MIENHMALPDPIEIYPSRRRDDFEYQSDLTDADRIANAEGFVEMRKRWEAGKAAKAYKHDCPCIFCGDQITELEFSIVEGNGRMHEGCEEARREEAKGTVISSGGFDSYLSLFNGTGPTATFVASNDDGGCGPASPNPASGGYCEDSRLDLSDLAAGSYTVALTLPNNYPSPRTTVMAISATASSACRATTTTSPPARSAPPTSPSTSPPTD